MMDVKTRLVDRSRGYTLTVSFRKCSAIILSAIFILSVTLYFQPVTLAATNAGNYIVTEGHKLCMITPSGVRTVIYDYGGTGSLGSGAVGVAVDSAGNYIVVESSVAVEWQTSSLGKITPGGVRTLIYAGLPYTYWERVAIDSAGNYIVTEGLANKLSKITPGGVRTEIYSFASGTNPSGVAIDSAGNYIVAEEFVNTLSRITPSGVRTVIYSFAPNTWPLGVAIDGMGNYLVTESYGDKLSKITPAGVRTVIYSFALNTQPSGVAIDSSSNYVVAEGYAGKLSRITPGGVRTVVYDYGGPGNPWDVAIVPGATPTYSATIWAFAENEGWMDWIPITMDGVPTGQVTPYTFTGLTGTRTFTVPSTEPQGRVFYEWDTGWTGTTLTVTSGGTYTARYRQPGRVNTQVEFAFSPNPATPGKTITLSGTLKTVGGIAVYPATVKVEYSTNGGVSYNFFVNLNTNAAGQFSKSFGAPGVGTYLVRVSYAGSANYNPSSQTQTLMVQTGVSWTYNFRVSPGYDILHFNLKGPVIYGIAENNVIQPFSNAPVIGYVDGGTFYLWIDAPDNLPTFYELVMMVGSVSTLKGNVYQTQDGTTWRGPTPYSLVPVAATTSSSSEQTLASSLTIAPQSWPATYNFRINPFVDVVHLSVDGQLIHGQCDATSYTDQPILGWLTGSKFIITTDFTKYDDGSEILYELSMNVVSVSTLSGSLYRTVDGKSVVGPTPVTFTPAPP